MNLKVVNAEIWLHILRSGGWWTAFQIDQHFAFKPGSTYKALHEMARYGSLTKKPVEGSRLVKFAVTADCHVPGGIPVGEVQVNRVLEASQ